MDILSELKDIVSEAMPELEKQDITPESRLKEDLGMGSLELMLTAVSAEERFGIEFDDSLRFETVGDIIACIEKRTGA